MNYLRLIASIMRCVYINIAVNMQPNNRKAKDIESVGGTNILTIPAARQRIANKPVIMLNDFMMIIFR